MPADLFFSHRKPSFRLWDGLNSVSLYVYSTDLRPELHRHPHDVIMPTAFRNSILLANRYMFNYGRISVLYICCQL